MSEFDRLKARIAELEEVIRWIASQQNLFFAECSQAEKIIAKCKTVMAQPDNLLNVEVHEDLKKAIRHVKEAERRAGGKP